MEDNFFTIEHYKYGIGTAILIKHRRKRPDDLFMCSFKELKGQKLFYCRKDFDEAEEVWWNSDGKPRVIANDSNKDTTLEDTFKALFGGGISPINY